MSNVGKISIRPRKGVRIYVLGGTVGSGGQSPKNVGAWPLLESVRASIEPRRFSRNFRQPYHKVPTFSLRYKFLGTKILDTSLPDPSNWSCTSRSVLFLELQLSGYAYLSLAFNKLLFHISLTTSSFSVSLPKLSAHFTLSKWTSASSTSNVLWQLNERL